jgi:hypothetical protein
MANASYDTTFARRVAHAVSMIDGNAELTTLIGKPFYDFCAGLAASKGCDASAVYPLVISTLSALVGNNVTICVDKNIGHEVRLICWYVTLNWSGCGKSPVVDIIRKAVKYVDRHVKSLMRAKLEGYVAVMKQQHQQHEREETQQVDGEDAQQVAPAPAPAGRGGARTRGAATAAASMASKRATEQSALIAKIRTAIDNFSHLDTCVTMEAKHLTMLYQMLLLGITTKVRW